MVDQANDSEIEDAVNEALVDTDQEDAADVSDDSTDDVVDDASDEGTDAEADGATEPAAKKPSRGETRIQTLLTREREAQERADRAERRAAELEASRTAVSESEAARIREEKLSLMDPQERENFHNREEIQRLKNAQAATQMYLKDATDKAAYDAKATINPIYEKHKDAVEKALNQLRSNGTTTTREELLKWVIGHEALNAKPAKAQQAQKQAAAVRVSAAKGKPTSVRGDSGEYTGKGTTEEDRLRGVFI